MSVLCNACYKVSTIAGLMKVGVDMCRRLSVRDKDLQIVKLEDGKTSSSQLEKWIRVVQITLPF